MSNCAIALYDAELEKGRWPFFDIFDRIEEMDKYFYAPYDMKNVDFKFDEKKIQFAETDVQDYRDDLIKPYVVYSSREDSDGILVEYNYWKSFPVKFKDTQELDDQVFGLMETRRLEEEQRLHLVSNPEKIQEMEKNPAKPLKVRPFTANQLERLVHKYKSQPWLKNYSLALSGNTFSFRTLSGKIENAELYTCEQHANALVILDALEKRYGNPENMRHELWKPGGPMCEKIWSKVESLNDENAEKDG